MDKEFKIGEKTFLLRRRKGNDGLSGKAGD